MRNFKFLITIVILAITAILFSCSDDKEQISKGQESEPSSTLNKSTNIYPVSNYVLWQIKDKPYTVIFTPSGSNNHIWIIQNENNFRTGSTLQLRDANFGFYKNGYLKLSSCSEEYLFLIANNLYKALPTNAVGLSKVIDDNLLTSLREIPNSFGTINGSSRYLDAIIDDIADKATCRADGTSDKSCKCSGGANSTSCECSGGIATASWHEATSCKTGYYACCSGLLVEQVDDTN